MLEMSEVGDGLFRKGFAGDTFNMAHYLNVTTAGKIKAEYLTAVGQDADSDACLEFIEKKGVLTTRCLRSSMHTLGLFTLSNDANGEKQYGYWRGQSAARHIFDYPQDLTGYDLIYYSGITAAITQNKPGLISAVCEARQQGATIAFDFNYRQMLWSADHATAFAEEILPNTDIVKISDEELMLLFPGQTVELFSNQYPDIEWVLTCSEGKAEVWKGGVMLADQTFNPIKNIVDSSAAGDAFIATYLAAKLASENPLLGIKRAHAVASQVVCGKGSIVAVDLSVLDKIHD